MQSKYHVPLLTAFRCVLRQRSEYLEEHTQAAQNTLKGGKGAIIS